MPLVEVELARVESELPKQAVRLIADARRYITTLEDESQAAIPAFVPSDFELVYRSLVAIQESHLVAGRRFIEWGSGVGVVTCLAALAGFDAVGIEIEPNLVDIARDLAADHGIDAQFSCGSFVPDGVETSVDLSGDVNWLSTTGDDGYVELELEPDDFDLVFAYPWPGEEQVIFDLFADTATIGALVLTYHGIEGVRLQRKVRR
jgi:predicted O-methyltransferase YrrM